MDHVDQFDLYIFNRTELPFYHSVGAYILYAKCIVNCKKIRYKLTKTKKITKITITANVDICYMCVCECGHVYFTNL